MNPVKSNLPFIAGPTDEISATYVFKLRPYINCSLHCMGSLDGFEEILAPPKIPGVPGRDLLRAIYDLETLGTALLSGGDLSSGHFKAEAWDASVWPRGCSEN